MLFADDLSSFPGTEHFLPGAQGSRPSRVIEWLNVRWVGFCSLEPARLHDHICNSLTTSTNSTSVSLMIMRGPCTEQSSCCSLSATSADIYMYSINPDNCIVTSLRPIYTRRYSCGISRGAIFYRRLLRLHLAINWR